MKNVKVIVGNNFGDEGKGLLSRYYALNSKDPIVIFYNGSAQRGHTVETRDGKRFVMHHFGAGTLDNIPTYFAKTFMVHPMTFELEFKQIADQFGIYPFVYADHDCQVVTPIDMFIDMMYEDYLEEKLGKREYGSCCQGTWSCTDRIKAGIDYSLNDFYSGDISIMLDYIIKEFLPKELKARGIDKIPEKWQFFLEPQNLSNVKEKFKSTIRFMVTRCPLVSFDHLYSMFNDLIFEGAQGLMLDKDFELNKGWNTSSHTGMDNVISILNGKNDFEGEVCYVSRSYATRHGDGPFKEIDKFKISKDLTEDKTNVYNPYQGNLKYSFLNENLQKSVILKDSAKAPNFKVSRALTHCDEFEKIPNQYNIISNSRFAEEIKRR